MTQRVMIEVESEKPLSDYGDGHIILFDNSQNKYYVTSRERFLSVQNAKIKCLEQAFEEEKKQNAIFREQMKKEYSEFIKQYKETNGKLINMVKSVVMEEK